MTVPGLLECLTDGAVRPWRDLRLDKPLSHD